MPQGRVRWIAAAAVACVFLTLAAANAWAAGLEAGLAPTPTVGSALPSVPALPGPTLPITVPQASVPPSPPALTPTAPQQSQPAPPAASVNGLSPLSASVQPPARPSGVPGRVAGRDAPSVRTGRNERLSGRRGIDRQRAGRHGSARTSARRGSLARRLLPVYRSPFGSLGRLADYSTNPQSAPVFNDRSTGNTAWAVQLLAIMLLIGLGGIMRVARRPDRDSLAS
jgi:hypothetical protein